MPTLGHSELMASGASELRVLNCRFGAVFRGIPGGSVRIGVCIGCWSGGYHVLLFEVFPT